MKIILPEHVKTIINTLKAAGHDAYAVGGCVRDSVLGREPQDWDITTSAKPEQVKALFRFTIDTGIQHGTVTVMLDHEGYEVTTYRIDGEYTDGRHPDQVEFTSDLLEDLKRRDFTINAMAYNEETGFVDAFDGLGDIERKVIRCVGKAQDRFGEDALRMMRAVRFAAQLGFEIEADTFQAITELAPTIARVSAERIQVELVKLIASPHPEEMRTLYECGITDVILPEFSVMMKKEQYNPHHCYTVGEHTVRSMMQIKQDKTLRLAMLLHDVAKPDCAFMDEKGVEHYYGHPEKGADMARGILRRLKFDNDTIHRVCGLVRFHDDNPPLNHRAVRRGIVRDGIDLFPDMFLVKRADIQAQSTYKQQEKLEYVDAYEAMYCEIRKQEDCLTLKELAVTGKDLIQAGVQPGKEIGELLQAMLNRVLDHPEDNEREVLLHRFLK